MINKLVIKRDQIIEMATQDRFIAWKVSLNQALIEKLPKFQTQTLYCFNRYEKFMSRKRGVYPKFSNYRDPIIIELIKGEGKYE